MRKLFLLIPLIMLMTMVMGGIDVKASPAPTSEPIVPIGLSLHEADPDLQSQYDNLSGLEKGAYNLYEYIISPPSAQKDFLLVNDAETNSVFQSSIYVLCKTLANYLMIIYLLLEIDKLLVMSSQDFNLKGLWLLLLKFAFGVYIVNNIDTLIQGFFEINNAIVNAATVQPFSDDLKAAASMIMNEIDAMGLFDCIGLILSLLLAVLGAAIGNIMVSFQSVSRTIELLLRGMFAPIAIADAYKGLDSNGIRYLKKFFACALFGVGILAVINIGGIMSGALVMSAFGSGKDIGALSFMFQLIVIPLSMGGACGAVKQVCNDAMGV